MTNPISVGSATETIAEEQHEVLTATVMIPTPMTANDDHEEEEDGPGVPLLMEEDWGRQFYSNETDIQQVFQIDYDRYRRLMIYNEVIFVIVATPFVLTLVGVLVKELTKMLLFAALFQAYLLALIGYQVWKYHILRDRIMGVHVALRNDSIVHDKHHYPRGSAFRSRVVIPYNEISQITVRRPLVLLGFPTVLIRSKVDPYYFNWPYRINFLKEPWAFRDAVLEHIAQLPSATADDEGILVVTNMSGGNDSVERSREEIDDSQSVGGQIV